MNWMMKMVLANMKKRGARTILTILGIVIGVLSIVLMTAVGIGMKIEMMKTVEASGGLTEIRIMSNNAGTKKDRLITERSIDKIKKDIPEIIKSYPCQEMNCEKLFGKYAGYCNIIGVPKEYLERYEIVKGENSDKKGLRPQLYLCENTMRIFFNEMTMKSYYEAEDMEKKDIDLTGKKIKVVMTGSQKELTDEFTIAGQINSSEYEIFCEIDALKKYMKSQSAYFSNEITYNGEWIYSYAVMEVDSRENVKKVVEKLQKKGYIVESNIEYVESAEKETKLTQTLLGVIGTIAFTVAIIGIINTMTTSVYDRIKDIGVLKVLGCEPAELQFMFLAEAGIMGLIGGTIGVGVSYLAAYGIVNTFIVKMMEMEKGTKLAVIPDWLTIVAILVSVVVSMLAGYFPSMLVRKMTPVKAMKHE